ALSPPVAPDEVGGDAEKPRAGIVVARVVLGPVAERDDESLRGEVVRKIGTDPPVQVSVDGQKMAMEEHAELARIAIRGSDDLGIRDGSQCLLLFCSSVVRSPPIGSSQGKCLPKGALLARFS